jgi:hypothetical protein
MFDIYKTELVRKLIRIRPSFFIFVSEHFIIIYLLIGLNTKHD